MKLPPAFSKNELCVNVVIETSKGCAAKYNYDEGTGIFQLKKILPGGMVFESLYSLDKYLEKEIENFFNPYTELEKKEWKINAKRGHETAINLIKKNKADGNNK